MFRSTFDKTLETATSHLQLEPDWPSILLICDQINQKDVTPKAAFAAIKKKMSSPNPHSACYALLVLESVVKNCGAPMHDEVFTKENCEMFNNYLEQTTHENVRQKMLELVQTWAYAFRSTEKYQSIKDTMTILKTKGHTFPELKEADAMFTADTAPNWADGKVCHRCRVEFTFTNRKHHCRNCGQVFCGQCTSKQCPLPKYGIEKEVRVCDGCFTLLQRPVTKTSIRSAESALPEEYLKSSLAQQTQTPKSEQELKEEEELQLALALSQSEAEQKKQKQTTSYTFPIYETPVYSPPTAVSFPQQQEEEATNPDLAKYLNRSYWEQRKVNENSMASPSAPSPMPTPLATPLTQIPQQQKSADEVQIDEFAANMRTQVEIFVNRMKSNSSRGRIISNDTSVQSLFMTLTSLHSQQLSYIKEMDDKRMWYEQLQDKLAQIKDSRAALDVLRQEHVEKLKRQAEDLERQRQIQMAQKLEIMRKKKQEYLQYQRQLALQRIQEQEREMQMRQEQQKAQYLRGQISGNFPFMANTGSPSHMSGGMYQQFTNFNASAGVPVPNSQFNLPPNQMPGIYTTANHMNMILPPGASQMPQLQLPTGQPGMMVPPIMMEQQQQQQQQQQQIPSQPQPQPPPPPQQQQQQQMLPQHQQLPQMAGSVMMQAPPPTHLPQVNNCAPSIPQAIEPATIEAQAQIQAVNAAPAPPQNEVKPVATEPVTAELISFD